MHQFKQDFKVRFVLVLDWTRVSRSFYAYPTKDKTVAKLSSPRLLGVSFAGVISKGVPKMCFPYESHATVLLNTRRSPYF